MGKMDTQRGQRLTLRCSSCKRPLGIFYNKKIIFSPAKLIILNGSVHSTNNGTNKIHIRCKCGEKTVFENQTSEITKQGWKRIK
ncbi:MAG: hypothetical protein P8X91_01215 [Candidatus Bathyarchaeota archaeon]